jgi:hypothetical protein
MLEANVEESNISLLDIARCFIHCMLQDKFIIPCPKFGTAYYEIIM